VRPTRPGDAVKSPAEDTMPPNDPDFFLMGKSEMTREEARKSPVRALAGTQQFTGHMLDMPQKISNAAIQ
jgi:hypothetical protein